MIANASFMLQPHRAACNGSEYFIQPAAFEMQFSDRPALTAGQIADGHERILPDGRESGQALRDGIDDGRTDFRNLFDRFTRAGDIRHSSNLIDTALW